MSKRGPLAATDKRRQAGHKRPKHAGMSSEEETENNGAGKKIAHLFNDRSKANGTGKRVT